MRKNSAARKKVYNRSYGRVYHNFKIRQEPKLLRTVEKKTSILDNYRLDADGGRVWSF